MDLEGEKQRSQCEMLQKRGRVATKCQAHKGNKKKGRKARRKKAKQRERKNGTKDDTARQALLVLTARPSGCICLKKRKKKKRGRDGGEEGVL